jgi:hypothetical protein
MPITHESLLLLGRKLLVLDGIKGDRVVLLEINGELLKVPFLYVLMVRAAIANGRSRLTLTDMLIWYVL